MIRTQTQLTEEQVAALKEIAVERGVSVAELIRRGVDMVVATREAPGLAERRRRALATVGRFSDEASDVARLHDDYFDEAVDRRRNSGA